MKKKEQAKDYILHLIEQGDKHYAKKAAETLSVARSTIYNYTKELLDAGALLKGEDGSLSVVEVKKRFFYDNVKLDEASIYARDVLPLLDGCAPNVLEAWGYAFTEMMNNAIEHSESEHIMVVCTRNALNTTIDIVDMGVGIFNKIRNYMKQEKGEDLTLEECMSLLFTGKFTTAREKHSGEGIFFTSHLMDMFYIVSDQLFFTRNNFNESHANVDFMKSGTLVSMQLSNKSHKTVKEVFDRYTNPDEGFSRTSVPIAHMFQSGFPISRSEARRLGAMLSSFKEAVLDFAGVNSIGQAFTHELFVVWQRQHPDFVLHLSNMSQDVEDMMKRVKRDAGVTAE